MVGASTGRMNRVLIALRVAVTPGVVTESADSKASRSKMKGVDFGEPGGRDAEAPTVAQAVLEKNEQ